MRGFDKDGLHLVELGSSPSGGGMLKVRDESGKTIAELFSGFGGGVFRVLGSGGERTAHLRSTGMVLRF